MCPWEGPHAPSFGQQLWGLPSRVEYLSPQEVLLPLVYGTTVSPLWLELQGLSASQATPSWTVYLLACRLLLPWLLVTFAMVPHAAWPGSDQRPWGNAPAAGRVGRLRCPSAPDPWGVGSFLSLGRPMCARVCGVLGHLAPVHRCAHSVRCFACAVSWATWLLFTGVPAQCVACGWAVLGLLAPVHQCARFVRCFACAVSWATWLLFTSVPACCLVLLVRCPGPLGSCSPVYLLGALFCLCGVLGHLAPVHWCARKVRCVACALSWATWLLFTGVHAQCVVLRVGCPGPLGSCSTVCPLGLLPVCAVSWANWLLVTGAPARRIVLRVRCPGPLGSCSPVCPLGVLCGVCGVLGHLPPVHRCACSVLCFACAVSSAIWLLFTGVPARCVALRVRCPGPLGACSPVCPLVVLFCVCGVLDRLPPVHRCAWPVRCFVCPVSSATWLLFTGVPAWFIVLRVRCPGPLGSCSAVCPLGALLCVCSVLGHLAPVHRCACLVCCFVCAVSWATWLLFTGVPARCIACVCGVLNHLAPVHPCARSVRCLCLRCPGPLGSCSPMYLLGALFCLCGVLGHLAPVHRCARSVCCVACAVSSATWLLLTGVPAQCVVLRVWFPWPLGSCSPLCLLIVLCCGLCVRGVAAGRSLVHPDGGYS